jgi:hypothetical protein
MSQAIRSNTTPASAHAAMIAGLARLVPTDIDRWAADRFDIMNREEHIRAVVKLVTDGVGAVMADTGEFAPAGHLKNDAEALLSACRSSTTP